MKGKKFLAFSLTVAMLAGSALTVSAAGVKDVFSADYYAGQYSDLKATFGTDEAALLQHFMTDGAKEGRVMSPILDVAAYRKAYADLNAAYGDNWDAYVDHYLTNGIKEKRSAGVKFDLVDYAAKNPDVKAAFGEDYAAIAQHYVTFGIKEGRPGGTIATAAPAATGSNAPATTPSAPATPKPETPVTPAHVHDFTAQNGYTAIIDHLDPTCTKEGYNVKQCTSVVVINGKPVRCSYTERETLTAKHTIPDDAAWVVCATCTEPGQVSYTCTVCGAHRDETVKALGHDYNAKTDKPVKSVESTCTKAGYDVFKCKRCGAEITEARPLAPHKIAEWNEVTAPSCAQEGQRTAWCSTCGKTFTESIAKTPHQKVKPEVVHVDAYTNIANKPLHTNQNVWWCEDCGFVISVNDPTTDPCEDIAENGGTGNGKCDVCGLDMNRGRANSVKVYKVGEKFDIKNVQ